MKKKICEKKNCQIWTNKTRKSIHLVCSLLKSTSQSSRTGNLQFRHSIVFSVFSCTSASSRWNDSYWHWRFTICCFSLCFGGSWIRCTSLLCRPGTSHESEVRKTHSWSSPNILVRLESRSHQNSVILNLIVLILNGISAIVARSLPNTSLLCSHVREYSNLERQPKLWCRNDKWHESWAKSGQENRHGSYLATISVKKKWEISINLRYEEQMKWISRHYFFRGVFFG